GVQEVEGSNPFDRPGETEKGRRPAPAGGTPRIAPPRGELPEPLRVPPRGLAAPFAFDLGGMADLPCSDLRHKA
ncbi:MAG TPA: hypothetical protein PKD55_04350, partial [Bellilinea sp.]|nr:hypothetical protein [Bellilinea sp.]